MKNEMEKLQRFLALGVPLPHLEEALTHRSYAAENQLSFHYQRLEFLGDAVIDLILSELLFARYPAANEGLLSQLRAAVVREESLARFARSWELDSMVRLGKGARETGGAARNALLADVFEALLGAIHLDAGFDAARQVMEKVLYTHYPDPAALLPDMNPKGTLQEFAQRHGGTPPAYRILRTSGPDHALSYEVEVHMGEYIAFGRGEGRRAAESAAAEALLRHLRTEGTFQ